MDKTLWITFVGVLLFVILIGPLLTQFGWYLSITPIFGLEPISWVEAFGLNLLGSCVIGKTNLTTKK